MSKKRIGKRTLAGFLAAFMLLALFPTVDYARAEDSGEGPDGVTITVWDPLADYEAPLKGATISVSEAYWDEEEALQSGDPVGNSENGTLGLAATDLTEGQAYIFTITLPTDYQIESNTTISDIFVWDSSDSENAEFMADPAIGFWPEFVGIISVEYQVLHYNSELDKEENANGVQVTASLELGLWEEEDWEVIDTIETIKTSDTGSLTLSGDEIGWLGYSEEDEAVIALRLSFTIPEDMHDTYFVDRVIDGSNVTYYYDSNKTELDFLFTRYRELVDAEGPFYSYVQNVADYGECIYDKNDVSVDKTSDYRDGEEVHGYTAYISAESNDELNEKMLQLAKEVELGERDYAAIDLYNQDIDFSLNEATIAALRDAGWESIVIQMEDNDQQINYIGTSFLKDKAFDPTIKINSDEEAIAAINNSSYAGSYINVDLSGSYAGNIYFEYYSNENLFNLDFSTAEYNPGSDGYGIEVYGYYYNQSAKEFQNWIGNGIYASVWVTADDYAWLMMTDAERIAAGKEDYEPEYFYYIDLGDKVGSYVICSDELPKTLTGGFGEVLYLGETVKTQAQFDAMILSYLQNELATDSEYLAITLPEGMNISEEVFEAAKAKGITLKVKTVGGDAFFAFDSLEKLAQMSGDFDMGTSIGEALTDVDKALKNYTLASGTTTCDVSFFYDGILPGTTKVTLDLSGQGYTNGQTVYLYYYNPTTKALEIASSGIYMDGLATFEITHCSDYVVTNKEIKAADTESTTPANPAKPNTPNVPRTGDVSLYWVWLLLLSGIGIAVTGIVMNKKSVRR